MGPGQYWNIQMLSLLLSLLLLLLLLRRRRQSISLGVYNIRAEAPAGRYEEQQVSPKENTS